MTANTTENRPFETIVFQPSLFRGDLLLSDLLNFGDVSGSVQSKIPGLQCCEIIMSILVKLHVFNITL